jgi:hypothetical protein
MQPLFEHFSEAAQFATDSLGLSYERVKNPILGALGV